MATTARASKFIQFDRVAGPSGGLFCDRYVWMIFMMLFRTPDYHCPRMWARSLKMSRHHKAAPARRPLGAHYGSRPFAEQGRRCGKCGKAGALEVHHVKELAHGGTNDLSNLQVLCREDATSPIHRPVHGVESQAWQAMLVEGSGKRGAAMRRTDIESPQLGIATSPCWGDRPVCTGGRRLQA